MNNIIPFLQATLVRRFTGLKLSRRNPTFHKAQAMVEFALTIMLLITLIAGLIEFARALQAYLALVNATRYALRYAQTGEYDTQYCPLPLTSHCANNPDKDTKETEEDTARLPSIRDVARGVAVGPYIIDSATKGQPGYFHTTICSSREIDHDNHPGVTFGWSETPDYLCKNGVTGSVQDDAGGPGDRVIVGITYQHNLILPFLVNLVPSITLHAERTGIVENFRVSRVLGLPPRIIIWTDTPPPTDTPMPTDTPTKTFTPIPTNTPTSTDTPTPSKTPTKTSSPTQTATFTATPAPSCDMVSFNDADPIYLTGNDLVASVTNDSDSYDVMITGSSLVWNGSWHDQVFTRPVPQNLKSYEITNASNGNKWSYDSPDVALVANTPITHNPLVNPWAFVAGNHNERLFKLHFSNPLNNDTGASTGYYHAADFTLTLTYKVGSLVCPAKALTGRKGPVITPMPANQTITTGTFTERAYAYDGDVAGSPPADGSGITSVTFNIYCTTFSATYCNIPGSTDRLNVGNHTESIAPFCINGDSSGTCARLTPYVDKWPDTNPSVLIVNGHYYVYMTAVDTDPYPQNTRILANITINVIPPPTPTATKVQSSTPSNTPAPKPTDTKTPIPPTVTNTAKPATATVTKSNTPVVVIPTTAVPPTKTNTVPVPTATNTPVPTSTRTPTPTPSRTPKTCPGGGFDCD